MLEVLGEATVSIEPRQGSFDHPAPGKHLESLGDVGSLDDFDGPLADPAQGISEFVASMATICEHMAQPREAPDDFGEHQRRPVAVLNISGMHHGMDEIA